MWHEGMSREGLCGHVELVTPEPLTEAQMSSFAEGAGAFRCMVGWRDSRAAGIRLIVRLDGGVEEVAERLRRFDALLGCAFDEAAVVGAEPDEVAVEWQKLWINRF